MLRLRANEETFRETMSPRQCFRDNVSSFAEAFIFALPSVLITVYLHLGPVYIKKVVPGRKVTRLAERTSHDVVFASSAVGTIP